MLNLKINRYVIELKDSYFICSFRQRKSTQQASCWGEDSQLKKNDKK